MSPHKKLFGSSVAGELTGSTWNVHPSVIEPNAYALDAVTGKKLYEFSEQLYKSKLTA